jgi:2-oxoisovalerate dehydrogenase E1 component alpha subunit
MSASAGTGESRTHSVPAAGADALKALGAMYRARRFDEVAVALQRQGAISGYGQALGQEGAQIGALMGIRDEDMVFPSYRQPGGALFRGVTIQELLRFHARESFCPWDWRSRRFAPYAIPVGSQLAHAVGWAMADQRRGGDQVCLVFFGDGAASQGEVHEAMNFGAVAGARVIFFLENNGWAISMPVAGQTRAKSLHLRAQGYGIHGIQVDGNDIWAVRNAVAEASETIRADGVPVLIEAVTYRMAGHTTSDDPSIYRSAEEVDSWAAKDPIRNFAAACVAAGVTTEAAIESERLGVETEIDSAISQWLGRNK